MPDVREVFDMATQKVRPDPGAMERQHRDQRRSAFRRRVGGYGLAAAIVVGVVAFAIATMSSHGAKPPIPGASTPPVITTTPPPAGTGLGAGTPQLVVVSLDGSVRQRMHMAGLPQDGGELSLSRDGTKIAFADGNGRISTAAIDGTGKRVLDPGVAAASPAWSPDGARIAFSGTRNGNIDIYVMNADGSHVRRLTTDPNDDLHPSWSPDGTRIVYDSGRNVGAGFSPTQELYTIRATGGTPVRLTRNGVDDSQASYSPDGARIAFHRKGRIEIMDADGRHAAPLGLSGTCCTGFTPHWSPDGSEIAFTRYDASWRYGPEGLPLVAVYVLDVGSGTVSRVGRAELVTDSSAPQWLPSGDALLIDRVTKR
jgi:Tol biopolymer transport system component